jgi:hypothetical protein
VADRHDPALSQFLDSPIAKLHILLSIFRHGSPSPFEVVKCSPASIAEWANQAVRQVSVCPDVRLGYESLVVLDALQGRVCPLPALGERQLKMVGLELPRRTLNKCVMSVNSFAALVVVVRYTFFADRQGSSGR